MKAKPTNYQFIHPIEHDGKNYTIEFYSYDKADSSELTGDLFCEIKIRKEGEEIMNIWPPQYPKFDDKIKDELLTDMLRQWDVILTTYDK